MRINHWMYVTTFLLVTACTPKPVIINIPDNHPANPSAEEAVYVPPVNPFEDRSYQFDPANVSSPEDSEAQNPMTSKSKRDDKNLPQLTAPEMQLHKEHGQ